MHKKRVLIFHPHFTIAGGAGTFVLEVGSRLAGLNYEVIVVCIRADAAITADFQDKIVFIELGGELSSSLWHWINLPFFLRRLFRICDQIGAEIIFPQVFPANWWAFAYAIFGAIDKKKQKVFWMCQEPSAFIHSKQWINSVNQRLTRILLKIFNPLLKLIDLLLARKADYVFTNSKYGLEYATRIYDYPGSLISYLYLGTDRSFSLGDATPQYKDRQIQAITVCRLSKFKNIQLIIEAISVLKTKHNLPVFLKIVGKGEEELILRNFVREQNCQDLIEFCGAVSKDSLIELLSHSRAFVLASVDEPFGLAVVEAMACGTPAIVVNRGGPSEIVLNDVCGFQIEPLNSLAIAEKIKLLCYEQAVFERLSQAARDRAKLFNWDLVTNKLADKFEKI